MLSLPLICVVQISGTPVKKHTHGCLTDKEILLEVLPHSLHKLLVAISVKTKVWINQVELKVCSHLLLFAFDPLFQRVAVLNHNSCLLHDNLWVQEFPRWT